MKKNSLFWALGWVAAGSLAVVQGCGGDDDDGGATGGKGGSSGTAGTAGSSTGGKAGSAGSSTGGKAGSSGSSGAAGTAGTGGTSGAGGEGGTPGGAGEGGGSGGGDRAAVCAEYCDVYYATGCEAYDGNYYGDEAGCVTQCTIAIWELGDPGAAAGNSVHCRLTHAGFAADAADPTTHCGHSAANSTGICVP